MRMMVIVFMVVLNLLMLLMVLLGLPKGEGREIEMAEYEGANLSEARERKDGFEMPDIPHVAIPELREGAVNGVRMRDHSGGAGNIKRGSVKRQSEIMREKKK